MISQYINNMNKILLYRICIILLYPILCIAFIVIITPLGYIMRMIGYSHIILKKQNGSYFTIRNHKFSKKDMMTGG
jgi:hypothetical protein